MRAGMQFVCMTLLLIVPLGCGHRSSIDRKVIHGAVTCGGEAVSRGFIRFVPVEGTPGPSTAARIVDGRYRADNRGGVPLGKHRVEIEAQRPTGEMIKLPEGGEVEKTAEVGDKRYRGPQSPLTAEVTAEGEGWMDFDLPE